MAATELLAITADITAAWTASTACFTASRAQDPAEISLPPLATLLLLQPRLLGDDHDSQLVHRCQ
ncbi:MAG: hypothetical protein WKF73_19435 [Nocardioidaceae bacterium]